LRAGIILGILAKNEYLPEREERGDFSDNHFPFAIDKPEHARREVIKVVSVGGGGGNAINHVISKGIEGVDLLAVNTDARSLEMSLCPETIILGEKITKGLGAGAVPEIGERAARESIGEIRAFLRGSDMVYFTAGMGGGTGTGALPVIAAAAKEMGILTVAVVTKPFSFEGPRKKLYAEDGIEKLRGSVDALIVVPNDRLLEISDKDTPLNESFALADEVLRQAVLGVTNLITRPGMVNVDFADLKTVMKEAGQAVMGVGVASGGDRISKALAQAIESPLMECSMSGARGVLMNISCGDALGLHEIYEAAEYVKNLLGEDSNFIWGCVEDQELEDRVEVVIVATGFEAGPARNVTRFAFDKRSEPQYARDIPLKRRQESLEQFGEPSFELKNGLPPETQRIDGEVSAARDGKDARGDKQIVYAPAEEKPRLISEMKGRGAQSWVTDEAPDIKIKTDLDEFDVPSFTRKGLSLKSPQ